MHGCAEHASVLARPRPFILAPMRLCPGAAKGSAFARHGLVVLDPRLGHQLRDVMFGIACLSALIICFWQPVHSSAAMGTRATILRPTPDYGLRRRLKGAMRSQQTGTLPTRSGCFEDGC